jgi:hypothetical protein
VGRPLWREVGRVCSFQFFLDIASAAFLRSESHLTNKHILLFLFLGLPQLYPRALGFSLEQVKIKVMLRLTVSQSVCLGVESTLELVTRYYFLSESCCVVFVERPLWREVGSVCYQSLSQSIVKMYYNLHFTCHMFYVYTIYIEGLCQHRLSTADHTPSSVAYTTTAV